MTEKDKPRWQKLETVIAEIHSQLAPEAEVRHNHRVLGKCGRTRQLDVTLTGSVGIYSVFVVIECKRFTRRVTIDKVEAFAQKLTDVRANAGIMISEHGFDAGATAIAENNNIRLFTFREAEDADWKSLLGEDAWTGLVVTNLELLEGSVKVLGQDHYQPVALDVMLYGPDKAELHSLRVLAFEFTRQEAQNIIGDIGIEISPVAPILIKIEAELVSVVAFIVQCRVSQRLYTLNLTMAHGEVLEGTGGNLIYRNMASEGLDWAEVIKNSPSVLLTKEQHDSFLARESPRIGFDMTTTKRFIRLNVTQKDNA